MVVYYKTAVRYEFRHERAGWMPMTYKETGESTWERKGDQWKLVRGTTFRAEAQVDPAWVQQQKDLIDTVTLPDKH